MASLLIAKICLIVGLMGPLISATIDIDSRTRGIPFSNTNEGNRFCFAFLHNAPQTGTDLKDLAIFIGTQEDEPVQYRIRSGLSAANRIGTVNPGEIALQRYKAHSTLTNDGALNLEARALTGSSVASTNDFTGIIVETINSTQKIQVTAFSDSLGSSDGFCAVPLIDYPLFNPSDLSYTYAAFSPGAGSKNAMLGMVACEDLLGGDLIITHQAPNVPSTLFLSIGTHYFNKSGSIKSFLRTNERAPSTAWSTYTTAVAVRSRDERITGVYVESKKPVGIMVGHECAEVPLAKANCDFVTEQVPPSYTWGYNFFVIPFARRTTGYELRILPRYDDTSYTIHCRNGDTVSVDLTVEDLRKDEVQLKENRIAHSIQTQSYCCIQSDRPIAVMQYGKAHADDDNIGGKKINLGDPAIVWIPSISQYLRRHLFSNDVDLFPNDQFTVHAISVSVLSQCFNTSAITINGSLLQSDESKWTPIYCSTTTLCGYGINIELGKGTYKVEHLTPSCHVNVMVHGWGEEKGYAYPAGFGMNPVGETFYSIVGVNVFSSESGGGSFIARVYKSGDLSQESSIDVQTFALSGSNAATFGSDLFHANKTASFSSGQSFVDVSFSVRDDSIIEQDEVFGVRLVSSPGLNIGTPSSVEFTIIDDDEITIQFQPVTYFTTEGDTITTVTITAVTSQPLTVQSRITLRDIPGSATRNTDYQQVDDIITLAAGSNGFTFNVTILSNSEFEFNESFGLYMVHLDGAPLFVIGDNATVTISDTDVIQLSLSSSNYFTSEEAQYVTVRVTTSQPTLSDTVVNLRDQAGQAISGSDYNSFNVDLTIPAGQSSIEYNITILNDNTPEPRESFQVLYSTISGQSVSGSGSSNVTIIDTDTTIRFEPVTYFTTEGDTSTIVTITAVTSRPLIAQSRITLRDIPGSATRNTDYQQVNDIITLAAGSNGFTFNVTILSNSEAEFNESFGLYATYLDGAPLFVIGDNATVTISDTDVIQLSLSSSNYFTSEEARYVTIRVTTSQPTLSDTVVNLRDQAGQAISGSDYGSFNVDLTIPAGQSSIEYNITILNDNTPEPREYFQVLYSTISGQFVSGSGSSNVTIIDTDTTIRFEPVTYFTTEGDTNSIVTITAVTSQPLIAQSRIVLQDIPGNATRNTDYQQVDDIITLAAGSNGFSFNVTILSNSEAEFNESFGLCIYPIDVDTLIFIGDNATVTIFDADVVQLSLSSSNYFTNEEARYVTVRVTTSQPTLSDTVVNLRDQAGQAISGSDYNSFNVDLTIPAGQSSIEYNITILNDNTPEPRESFQVLYSTISGQSVSGSGSSNVTIIDTDTTIRFEPVTYFTTEGDTSTIVTITAVTSRPLTAQSRIVLQDIPGSATRNTDYQQVDDIITLAAGSNGFSFNVTILSNSEAEFNESFGLYATYLDGAPLFVIGDNATVTISDTDVIQLSLSSSNYFTSEEARYVTIRVTTSQPTLSDTVVNLRDQAGQAISGSDYGSFNVDLTIPAGQSSIEYNISIVNDNTPEPVESFQVLYSTISGQSVSGSGSSNVTIIDTDTTIRFEPVTYFTTEGDTSTIVTITAVTSRPLTAQSRIVLQDIPGSATRNTDYQQVDDIITLAAGSNGFTFNVTILSNSVAEFNESFGLYATYLDGAPLFVIGDNATVTISDTDVIELSLSSSNYFTSEEARYVTIRVTTSQPTLSDTVVNLRDQAGQAISGSDYSSFNVDLTIPAGQSSIEYNITILNDNTPEPRESFQVLYSTISGQSVSGDGSSNVTIIDTDRTIIQYLPHQWSRSEEEGFVELMIFINEPYFKSFLIEAYDFQFVNNQALRGIDYVGFNHTITINGGQANYKFNVTFENDRILEEEEEFGIRLRVLDDSRVDVAPIVERSKVSIRDSDTITVGFTQDKFIFTEPQSGAEKVRLYIAIQGQSAITTRCTVNFKDGTAIGGGTDYTEESTDATFSPNQNQSFIEVTLESDGIDEKNETFTVTLNTVSEFAGRILFSRQSTTVEIVDSDEIRFNIDIATSTTAVDEDESAEICITRTGNTVEDYTLTLETSPGSATADVDYSSNAQTFVFRSNETRVCRTFPIADDNIALEGNETFTVRLTSTTSGIIGTNNEGTVTIIDNDVSNAFFVAPLYEGDEGETEKICVNLTKPIAKQTTIAISRSSVPNCDQTEPGDITGEPPSLPFGPNTQQQCFTVDYVNDTVYENIECEQLVIDVSGSGLGVTVDTARLNVNDANNVVLDGKDVRVDEDKGPAVVCATISGTTTTSTEVPIHVTFTPEQSTTSSNPAESNDYDQTAKTATIQPGNTEVCVNITITDDDVEEKDEEFCVNLSSIDRVSSSPDNCNIKVTIADDDEARFNIDIATSTTAVDEDKSAEICITRTGNTVADYTLTLETSPGSATADVDYSSNAQTFVFRSNETRVCRTFPIADDDIALEGNETFTVRLTSTTSGIIGTNNEGTVTIIDNDVSNAFFVAPLYEGDEGETERICVNLTKPIAKQTTIAISRSPVSGSDGTEAGDITGVPSSLTFNPNTQQQCFTVDYVNDTVYENTESEQLVIDVSGSGLGVTVDTARINVNDTNNVLLDGKNVTVDEDKGPAVVCATISGTTTTSTEVPIHVTFTPGQSTTSSNPAESNDYDQTAKTATIQPGNTEVCVNITITDDDVEEKDEEFCVNLSSIDRVSSSPDNCNIKVTIADNDGVRFRVDIATSTTVVNEDGLAEICITRTGNTVEDYTLTLETSPGSATADVDYSSNAQTFVFRSNETRVCRTFPTADDNIALEGNETFTVRLTSTTSGIIGANNEGTVTIIDNDVSNAFFVAPLYEGDEGETERICVNLTKPIAKQTTIAISRSPVSGSDGTEAGDITGVPSSLTFNPNTQQQCFTVDYVNDTVYENTESEQLVIDVSGSGLGVTVDTARLDINDKNNVVLGGTDVRVDEDKGPAVVCATISGTTTTSTEVPIHVTFTPEQSITSSNPADSNDYNQTAITATIRPGNTEACVDIGITIDTRDENDEEFCVNLSSSDNTITFVEPMACTITVTIKDVKKCATYFADVAVVADESTSILSDNLFFIQDFIIGLVNQYRISDIETNLGLIHFSTSERTQVDIRVNQYTNATQLKSVVDETFRNIRNAKRGDETHQLEALQLAVNELKANGRPKAHDVIIFITDGIPEPKNQSAVEFSREIRKNGTSIYGVFVGHSALNREEGIREIQQLSTTGSAFTVNQFADLLNIVDDIIRVNCTSVRVTFVTSNVEVDESAGKVKVCLRKDGESFEDVILSIQSRERIPQQANNANGGQDFPIDVKNGIIFPRPDSVKCFYFNITDDNIDESDEVFQIVFEINSSSDIAYADNPIANITILDNDGVQFNIDIATSTTAVNEDKSAEICITRTGNTVEDYTLTLETSPGSATADVDYSSNAQTFVFRSNETRVCRTFPIADDNIALEGNETFTVRLTSTTSGIIGTNNEGTVTIIDNDVSNAFFVAPLYEGDEGETEKICVNLTKPIAKQTTIAISRSPVPNFDQTEAGDITGVPSSLTFNPNTQQQCFTVDYVNDTVYENTESERLVIDVSGSGLGVVVSSTELAVNDKNNVVLGGRDVTVDEDKGPAVVCATISGTTTTSTEVPIHVTFTPEQSTTSSNPADSNDYNQTVKTATIRPGNTEACVDIGITIDTRDENDEEFCVNLSSSDNTITFVEPMACTITVTIKDVKKCATYFADVAVVADESTSILSDNLFFIQDFIIGLVNQYRISDIETNLGLIHFSTSERTQVDIRVNQYTNATQLKSAVNETFRNIRSVNRGHETHQLEALQLAVNELKANGRPKAHDVIIFITDGIPEPKNQSAVEFSREIRKNGTSIYGVFVGHSALNREEGIREIQQLSTTGSAFTVNQFADLLNIVDDIIRVNCTSVRVTFVTSNVEVDESAGKVKVCLRKDGESFEDVILSIQSRERIPQQANNANGGEDFPIDVKNGIIFPREDSVKCFYFNITDDKIDESDEVFQIVFEINSSSDIAYADNPIANITILDNDVVRFQFQSFDHCYTEANVNISVCIDKIGQTTKDISLSVTAKENVPFFDIVHAKDGEDFVAITHEINFESAAARVCVPITLKDDSRAQERNKTFPVTLRYSSGVDSITVTIKDDDFTSQPATSFTDTSDITVLEGNGTVTVCINRDRMMGIDVNVTFTASNGTTAFDGIEFIGGTNVEVFPRNSLQVCSTFSIIDDKVVEKLKSFPITISLPSHSPSNLRANVTIIDDDDATIEFETSQYFVSENDSSVEVCVRTTNPLSIDVGIRFSTDSTPPANATADADYTSVIGATKTLTAGSAKVCFDVPILPDSIQEGVELFYGNFVVTNQNEIIDIFDTRVTINTGVVARVYITDLEARKEMTCIVKEPLKVTSFNSKAMYNFRGVCEHIFTQPCKSSNFVVVGDFLSSDLSMGRVGLSVAEGTVIIDESLTISSSSPVPSISTFIERDSNGNVTKVTVRLNSGEVRVERTHSEVQIIVQAGLDVCGLCGIANGTLVSSSGVILNDVINQTKVDAFANSWIQEPSKQVLRDDRRECAVIKNDTVIGDPLYEAALWVGNQTSKYALCYEIHGESGQNFNLISDLCVTVNAYYTPMNNPANGNIISAIGIVASDDTDTCHNISVVQNSVTGVCETSINGGPLLPVGSEWTHNGINVKQRMMSRVRINVPNCERVPLIMWVTCQNMGGEFMIRYDISRAVNLRPSSHGLLGQFYNIRMQAEKLTDQSIISQHHVDSISSTDDLWIITVSPPPRPGVSDPPTRRFVAQVYDRAWDHSRGPCLYAGNSQGGEAVEFIDGYSDSVIEGKYKDYKVANLFSTDFKYKMFDDSRC